MSDDKTNIIEKIQKLLRLGARAGTEAEAAAAMARAHALLSKHNLEMSDVEKHDPEKIVADREAKGPSRNRRAHDIIFSNVAELYYCESLTRRWKGNAGYTILGRPHNIAIVKFIAAYVCQTMMYLAKTESSKEFQDVLLREGVQIDKAAWADSFKLGFAVRIAERCQDEIAKAKAGQIVEESTGRALALAPLYNREQQAITEAVKNGLVDRKNNRRRPLTVRSRSGFEMGKLAAANVSLSANNIQASAPRKAIGG